MKETTNITKEEYERIRAKYDTYHAARESLCNGRNYVTVEESALLPESPTHDEISSIEVYEFRHNPPMRYFAYVHEEEKSVTYSMTHSYKIPTHVTTWTGEILGTITEYGHKYHSNMGDTRQAITVRMINGKKYHGIYFVSSGDYCRLKLSKG